jgi:hypothetical protein
MIWFGKALRILRTPSLTMEMLQELFGEHILSRKCYFLVIGCVVIWLITGEFSGALKWIGGNALVYFTVSVCLSTRKNLNTAERIFIKLACYEVRWNVWTDAQVLVIGLQDRTLYVQNYVHLCTIVAKNV